MGVLAQFKTVNDHHSENRCQLSNGPASRQNPFKADTHLKPAKLISFRGLLRWQLRLASQSTLQTLLNERMAFGNKASYH